MGKQLRLFAGQIIVDSKMPTSGKRTLLNFINEESITDAQIKVLLMDGEIVKLDEQAEDIVNDRFDNHPIKQMVSEGPIVTTVAVGVLVALIAKLAYNAARLTWSEGHRECLKYKGNDKQKCLAKYKKAAAIKMIKVLTANKNKCNKAKDPQSCIAKIDAKIAKAKKKADAIIP